MIRNFLIGIAKKHLGLTDTRTALAIQQTRDNAVLHNHELEKKVEGLLALTAAQQRNHVAEIKHIRSKYPTVWLGGDAAQGVVQLPQLKLACEFFREENKFCVFVPFNDAAGKKPTDFVPPWLEVDESLKVQCLMDRMNGSGVLYKIPVKGWDDTIELTKKAEDDHPNYSLDGKMREKTRSFRCAAGINGTFRREVNANGKITCHLFFHEDELPHPEQVQEQNIADYLPKGNLVFNEKAPLLCAVYGYAPSRIFHFLIPVREVELPKVGYQKHSYVAPKLVGFEPIAVKDGIPQLAAPAAALDI